MQDAVFFQKGRVALYALLKSLGVGPGDRVIVPGYTCMVVPAAVQFAGAVPCYADIDPESLNIGLAQVEAAAASQPVRAVIVQHTYGMPADMGALLDWTQRQGAWLIEDCCHAVGSRYLISQGSRAASWQPVGRLGDAAFFSSQWSKPLTTGLGGWAIARDRDLLQRIEAFAAEACSAPPAAQSALLAVQLGLYRRLFRPRLFWTAQAVLRRLSKWGVFLGSSRPEELEAQMPGDYCQRMAPWQVRRLRKLAAELPAHIAHRQMLKQVYDDALAAAGLPVYGVPQEADPVLLRYPVRVASKRSLLDLARRRHIELGDWFNHPLHPAGANVAALGWQPGRCPAAEKAAAEVVNLPIHPGISAALARRTIDFLRTHTA